MSQAFLDKNKDVLCEYKKQKERIRNNSDPKWGLLIGNQKISNLIGPVTYV